MITPNRKGPKPQQPEKLREIDAMRALMFERYRRNLVLNRYTPRGWWECDVFEMTQAGYFREYEIKISRSDFFADAQKDRRAFTGGIGGAQMENKHALLRRGDPRGPSNFWYVVPEGLVESREVPDFAGLIYLRHWQATRKPWKWKELSIRPAPLLHRIKPDAMLRQQAEGVCYWRWHGLMTEGQCLCKANIKEDSPSLPAQPPA